MNPSTRWWHVPIRTLVTVLLAVCTLPLAAAAVDDLDLGGVMYIGYQVGENQEVDYNQFVLRRAYLTVKKPVLPYLDARLTLDTSQDLEGDGRGDMEVRIKYAHGTFHFPDLGPLNHQSLEAGIVHGPWLAFEETVNAYRMRDKMFIERSGIVNSADFGVTYATWLGPELDHDSKQAVGKKHAGQYGSLALGIYNGGGYHAVEENTDNVFEARVSLRPLFSVLPGLQLSGFGVIGKGNSDGETDPIHDWNAWLTMLSYQHERFTVTAQYLLGDGNQKGSWVKPDGTSKSLEYTGWSFFGEWKPGAHWLLLGGYDYFDVDRDILKDEYVEYFAGIGYDFGHKTVLVFDVNNRDYDDPALSNEYWYQLTLQLAY